jgi:general secretion pathway protein D
MQTLARRTAAVTIPALLTFAVATALAQSPPPSTMPASADTQPADTQPTTAPATMPAEASATTAPAPTVRQGDSIVQAKRVAFNFKDASVDAVLNYLSEALDFIVVKDTQVTGRVTIVSKQPVTAAEAVDALNSVLKPLDFTVLQTGRVLHIVSVDKGKQNAPVHYGANPAEIAVSDQIITQVIPVASVDSTKLKNDLQPMLNPDATIVANQGSNTIVVTDTSANIRRMVEIIAALDQHKESISDILIRQLKYANATNAATLINSIFKQDTTTAANQQGRGGFGGGGGGFGGRFFGPGGGGGAGGGQGGAAATDDSAAISGKINASADDRTNTVVVSGPTSALVGVGRVLDQIDSDPVQDSTFFLYNMKNGQAVDIEPVLNTLFGNSTSGSSSSNTNRPTTSTLGSSSGGGFSSGFGGSSSGGGGSRGGGGGSSSSGFGGSSSSSRSGSSSSSSTANRSTTGTTAGGSRSSASASNNSAIAALQGQVFVVANADTNSLLVTTSAKFKDQVMQLIEDLDRPVPQVLIKVLIAEVTHNDTDDIGVQLSALDQRLSGNGIVAGTDFGVSSATGGLKIGLVEQNASATLEALATNNKLDVLSRPYILTSDNQEASMIVGQEVPIITNSQITDTGQTINSVSYQDVGIILDVTPHINPDGMVTLDIAPQVSQLDAGGGVPISSNVDAPVFDIRAAQSRVGVEDGKTIVIGGLMQDERQQSIQKVPILGDIPYLGMLFKRTINTKIKTELLIFLSPHVALRPDALPAMSKDEMRGTKLVPNAVSPGTFQDQIRGMERGEATTRPGDHPSDVHTDVHTSQEPGTK